MAHEFTKLSEVDLITESTDNTNILIEEDGNIKRINKSGLQAQADWNETDESNPAFILNKPEKLGGADITWFSLSTTGTLHRGYNSDFSGLDMVLDGYEVISAADRGLVKIFKKFDTVSGAVGNVIYYTVNTYMKTANIYYADGPSNKSISIGYSGPTTLTTGVLPDPYES